MDTLSDALAAQALICEALGSTLYATLLTKATEDVAQGGPCAKVLADYQQASRGDAVPLRFMAGVHALVLSGRTPDLAAHYPSAGGDASDPERAWPAFRAAVDSDPERIRAWLTRPPQTNEVGRVVPLIAGLLAALQRHPLPVRLLEIGASAGLNLRADRFRWTASDVAWGPADSPVTLADVWPEGVPGWLAEAVRRHPAPIIAERMGCDPDPVDPCTAEGALALRSYIWPDQSDRTARLAGALQVARRTPAQVVRRSGEAFLREVTLKPGTLTVVWHSVMRQYLSAEQWNQVSSELNRLAAMSSEDAPFAHVWFEPKDMVKGRFTAGVRVGLDEPVEFALARPHGFPAIALPKGPRIGL